MRYETFRDEVQTLVATQLGEPYSVELQRVRKNNGVFLDGLRRGGACPSRCFTAPGGGLRCNCDGQKDFVDTQKSNAVMRFA